MGGEEVQPVSLRKEIYPADQSSPSDIPPKDEISQQPYHEMGDVPPELQHENTSV